MMDLTVGISSQIYDIIFSIIIFLMAAQKGISIWVEHKRMQQIARAKARKEVEANGDQIAAIFSIGLFQNTIRNATPVILAALGGLFTEHAGIMNIGMEGMILTGAFVAVAFSFMFVSARWEYWRQYWLASSSVCSLRSSWSS